VPPHKKIKPKRTLMVEVATLAGFSLAILIVFLMEYAQRAADNPENKETIEMLRRYASIRQKKP